MFSKLYLTIKANVKINDFILHQISKVLTSWGVDEAMIDWDVYSSRAKLEVTTDKNNYQSYLISKVDLKHLMELCFDFEFVMTIIDNNGKKETYTTYYSKPVSNQVDIDVSELA